MTQSKLSGWDQHWYEVTAVIGCGEEYLPLEDMEAALRLASLEDTLSLEVEAASGDSALVRIVTRARHAGAASVRAGDLLTHCPKGWEWASAEVEARPVPEEVPRWELLEVIPAVGKDRCADAALVLAGWCAGLGEPAKETTELLDMTGLRKS